MRFSRYIATLAIAEICILPAAAATYSPAWHNVFGNGTPPVIGTSVNIGADYQSAACGSILQGDILVAELSTETGALDPGQASTPTGFTAAPAGTDAGWTSPENTVFRSSIFYQVVDAGHAGETCSFASSWANTAAAGGLSWTLIDFRPSGGSPPGSAIDSTDSQGYHDNVIGNSAVAPSVTLTNSGDLFVTFYAEWEGNYQLTVPGSQTKISDTFAEGGTYFSLETLVGYDTSPPSSGSAGTRTASYSNSFVYFINGSIGFNQPTSGGATPTYGLSLLGVGH